MKDNNSSPKSKPTSVDEILDSLVAVWDETSEILAGTNEGKTVGVGFTIVGKSEAKAKINRLIEKQVVEAILIELHKLYDNRNLITPEIGTSIFMVRANDIKERIIALNKELEEKK